MQSRLASRVGRRALLVVFLAAAAGCSSAITTGAGHDGPAQTVYSPPGGKGPIVLLLSGHSGPDHDQSIAAAVGRLGYYAVLLDGKDILTREQDGRGNLRQAIARAQTSPHALPGKTVVIGFSQGGGAALVHAADMPEVVSAVVAYYPQTNFVADAALIARRFQVPVLILAGQRDTYHNCCRIESMRAIERGARERSAVFELVVYPYAEHGFNCSAAHIIEGTTRPTLGSGVYPDFTRESAPAFHCVYSSGRHTAHGRYPAATAVCSSAKNTRFLTYPPRAMARSAAGQSSLPYARLGRWPPSAPGVALW